MPVEAKQQDPSDLSTFTARELFRNGEGIADMVLIAMRDSASYLGALRYAALAHQQGESTRLEAALAPFLPNPDRPPEVLDDPLTALATAIRDGTPEEVRVKQVIDAEVKEWESVAAIATDSGNEATLKESKVAREVLSNMRKILTGEG